MTATSDRPLVVLYQGNSCYGSLNTMVSELAAAIGRQGGRPVVIDLRQDNARDDILALVRGGAVGRIISLNGLGLPRSDEDCGLYRDAGVPIVLYAVDHPVSVYPSLQLPLPTLVATFPTRHNVEFCRSVVSPGLRCVHLPHAAAPVAARRRPWRFRDVPLLLSASLQQQPDAARAGWAAHGPTVSAALNAMVEAHEAAPARPLDQVIGTVLGEGAAPDMRQLASYFVVLDDYLRNRLRQRLVTACKTLPLTVCGSGWSAGSPGFPRVLGPQPVQEVFALMARAKIVLNPLPPYYESHERPFQAMARGAAAATSPMPWFTDGRDEAVVIGLSGEPDEAAERLATALADDAGLEDLGTAGHAAFLAGETWDHRAQRLLSA